MKNLKFVLIAIIALACLALVIGRSMNPSTSGPADQALPVTVTGPFEGMPIRFDGYYRNQLGDLIYLIRFFPEGRVVSVNGTTQVEKDLPQYLIPETKGNPTLGLYNVPVTVEGDSLMYTTRPEKGEIEYRGTVVSNSMVRLLRHSHITGTKQVMEYIFYPDETPSQ
ncbi:MAG: hypothetical protein KDC00_05165 [Flavobacteriales bacterium]|nr:hypothetical protein [Flavobacteriales bacterium]